MNLRQNLKWVAIIGLPVIIVVAVAYAFLSSQKSTFQAKVEAVQIENDIMQGELYRLRQELEGRDARIRQLVNPELQRFKARPDDDSSSFWLYWRESDGNVYVEVSHITLPSPEEHYRIYAGSEGQYVGSFEAISETVGLQKVGQLKRLQTIKVTKAVRDLEADFRNEPLVYRIDINH